MDDRAVGRNGARGVWMTVLFFGALWGAVEALFGGLLHVVLPPTYQGKILLAIAAALMALAVRRTGRVWAPLGMALIASPLKLFSALVFALPVSAPAVLNPALAILAEGGAFALLAGLLLRRRQSATRFLLAGVGAGVLQSLLYVGLVRGPGLWSYPSAQALKALGTKFPNWVLSLSGIGGFLSTSIPYAALGAGIACLAIGLLPLPARTRPRLALLFAGSAACLAISFLASWLI